MSFAPKALLDVRAYVKPLVGLSDVELGIVGDDAHDGGYHHGWDQRRIVDGVLRDYSWNESPRDWNHKSNASRAFDLGWFDRVINGRRLTLIDFNLWVVAECQAGAPDTLDLREVIYTPDGKVVKRWDRLGKRSTGDPSHLRHTHLDWFADAEHRDKTGLFRRFFTANRNGDNDMYAKIGSRSEIYRVGDNGLEHLTGDQAGQAWSAIQKAGVPLVVVDNEAQLKALEPKKKTRIADEDRDAIIASVATSVIAKLPTAEEVAAAIIAQLSPSK